MKILALFTLLLALPALAAPPVQPTKSRYTPLWVNSPFTAKPIINTPTGPPPVNPMDDYALGGVTKFPEGYFVVLLNKKDPSKKVTIQPGVHSDFKVLNVNMGTERLSSEGKMVVDGASVQLANGSMQGEVKYDEKIMAMKGPSANPAQPNGNMLNNRPMVIPNPNGIPQPNTGANVLRPTRIRTIPPPVQPDAAQIPQVQAPQQQFQQGSPAQPYPVQPNQ